MASRQTCPACGVHASVEARYCDHCGTSLSQRVPSRRGVQGPGRIAVWAFLVILLALFGTGAAGGYLYKAQLWPWKTAAVTMAGMAPEALKDPLPVPGAENRQQENYLRSVVAITVRGQSGNRDGSGFLISQAGHIVTAAHVVKGAECVTVTDYNLKQHQGKVMYLDENWDVALIGVPTLVNPPAHLELGQARPSFDEELYILGYPKGAGAAMHSTVRYTNTAGEQRIGGLYFKELLMTQGAPVLEGTSGGPLVQKSTGRVLGVVNAGGGSDAPIGYAVPIDSIRSKLSDWKAVPLATCSADATRKTVSVSLAAIVPQSGRYGVWGNDLADGAYLALRDMETELRRAGYEVALQRYDDQGSPALAAEIARRVDFDPAVIGVLGSLDSLVTAEIAGELRSSGMVLVAPMATADSLTDQGWPHFNRLAAHSRRQGPAAARFIAGTLQGKAVYLLEDGSPDAAAQAQSFEVGAQVISLRIAERAQLLPTTDYRELKERIAAARADVVYYAGRTETALQAIAGLRSAGIALPIVGTDVLNDSRFRALPVSASQGVYFTTLTVGDNDKFRRLFEDTLGKSPGGYAAYGYDAARVILEALVRYGLASPAKVPSRTELAALVRQTRGQASRAAPSASITFDGRGDNLTSLVYLFEWEYGRPQLRNELP